MTDDREPFREAREHEAWTLEKSPNWAKPDRSEMEAARAAGLQKRHEQRLENATYTAAEVKVLTEAALRLGRKEALDEVEAALIAEGGTQRAIRIVQEARTDPSGYSDLPRDPQAVTEPQEACTSVHPMAPHIHCVRPAGHKSDHVSRNGRNWRPKGDPT